MGRGVQLLLRRVCQYRDEDVQRDRGWSGMPGAFCSHWMEEDDFYADNPVLILRGNGGSLGIRQVCRGLHRH